MCLELNKLKLRPYQKNDVAILKGKISHGIFSEQRTGKTVTALVASDIQGAEKTLIICPASMIYDWKDEFEKWLHKPCIVYDGQRGDEWINEWTHGLVISYDSLKSTKAYTGQAALIKKMKPDSVIVDEAHRLKGRTTARAKAVFKFNKVPYRLALTGTPAPNELHDIWAILHFLRPHYFSSYWKFVDEFFLTTQRDNRHGSTYKDVGPIYPEKKKELNSIVAALSIQHKRKDVMPWLPDEEPPKLIRLPTTKLQQKYLSELEEYYETEDIITYGELDRLIRYRQICNAPELLGLKGKSPKIEWLKKYIADYPDKPIIVFSKFKQMLYLIKKEIAPSLSLYCGDTIKKNRQQLKNDFQSGKINILLIQTDAGKEGLTLDRAEAVIFVDVYPPASDFNQAKDRIVPTSKDKADIPKHVITLAMRDTYDEEIYMAVQHNLSVTDLVNDYKKYKSKYSKGE